MTNRSFFGFILLIFSTSTAAYKVAIFVPSHGRSLVIFNENIAEVLRKAGHNVTLIHFQFNTKDPLPTKPSKENFQSWLINAEAPEIKEYWKELQANKKQLSGNLSYISMIKILFQVFGMYIHSCEAVLKNKDFLKQLEEQKFDIALAHTYDSCPVGLIHLTKIPTFALVSALTLTEHLANAAGAPSPYSYIPSTMASLSDEMTFIQRIYNFLLWTAFYFYYPRLNANPETALFRKYIGSDFPDLKALGNEAPLYFINSNELYDFARPTLHKIVNIGGIGIDFDTKEELPKEFKRIVNRRDKCVIMAIGSIARMVDMPMQKKEAFLNAFSKFPDYHFIVRYEGDDLNSIKPKNVHLFKWLPQKELLRHPHVKAFISHVGYNSLQETIVAAKPIVAIPLFADQPRNARIAEKRGFGYYVEKTKITESVIVSALNAVLHNQSYTESVRRLSAMVRKQPVDREVQLIRWVEFLAEFRDLPNLVPYGTKLGFIQYHSLDVIAFLSLILLLIVFTIFTICKFILQRIYKKSPKKQKTN